MEPRESYTSMPDYIPIIISQDRDFYGGVEAIVKADKNGRYYITGLINSTGVILFRGSKERVDTLFEKIISTLAKGEGKLGLIDFSDERSLEVL